MSWYLNRPVHERFRRFRGNPAAREARTCSCSHAKRQYSINYYCSFPIFDYVESAPWRRHLVLRKRSPISPDQTQPKIKRARPLATIYYVARADKDIGSEALCHSCRTLNKTCTPRTLLYLLCPTIDRPISPLSLHKLQKTYTKTTSTTVCSLSLGRMLC